MPTKKLLRPKKVEPKIKKKVRTKKLNTILIFDRLLIPLPTPESADNVDPPIMIIKAKTIPAEEADLLPSSSMSYNQSPTPIVKP